MQKSLYTKERLILCQLLHDLRKKSGMQQVELAKKLDEYQSFISKYESGERRLDLVEIRIICQAIGITLSEFITIYEEKINET